MSAVQTENQKKVILTALNHDPRRFLSRGSHIVQITDEENCKIARNNVKGGIVVWTKEKTFNFQWDRTAEKWF